MERIVDSRVAMGATARSTIRITVAAALATATVLVGFMHAPPVEVALGALAACVVLWWRSR